MTYSVIKRNQDHTTRDCGHHHESVKSAEHCARKMKVAWDAPIGIGIKDNSTGLVETLEMTTTDMGVWLEKQKKLGLMPQRARFMSDAEERREEAEASEAEAD